MSTDFNWNTDEEQAWDEPDEPIIQETQRWRPPRWLVNSSVILALLVALGFLVSRAVTQQLTEVSDDVAFTVLDAVALSQQAAASGDVDLFTSGLSGRDLTWSADQKDLVRQGLWHDRPQLGLALVAPAGSDAGITPTEADVTLNPALQSAEISLTHIYTAPIGNGLSEEVRLQQTVVYRKGASSWLLAPPEDSFWGEQTTYETPIFQAVYPQRDEAFTERLVNDLTQKFMDLCHTGWIGLESTACVIDEPVATLSFSISNRYLLELQSGRFEGTAEFGLADVYRLPAASLIGLPLDEASYQALYRGYASLLFGQMIQDASGYTCCHHRLFFEAILQLQLNTLGLQPWPLGLPEYQALLRQAPVPELGSYYDTTVGFADPALASRDLNWIFALTMYQSYQEEIGATAQIRRLRSADTLAEWLAPLTGPEPFSPAFYDSWREFIYRYASQTSQPPPNNTAQSLLLNCLDARRDTPSATVLTSWSPATGQFSDRSFYSSSLFMIPLAGDDGLVLHEGASPLGRWNNLQAVPTASRTILWQAGIERQLSQLGLSAPRLTFSGLADPAGNILLVRQNDATQGFGPARSQSMRR